MSRSIGLVNSGRAQYLYRIPRISGEESANPKCFPGLACHDS